LAALLVWITVWAATAARAGDPSPLETPGPAVLLPLVIRQPTPEPTATPAPPYETAVEQQIMDLINAQRTANELPPLMVADELTLAARRHSLDMATNGFTGHIGSDGTTACQRIEQAGYEWVSCGEIIAWGFAGDSQWVVDWWMNSPVHRAMILSTYFDDFGCGYVREPNSTWVTYWTVNFGRRAESRSTSADSPMPCVPTRVSTFGAPSSVEWCVP
jgi:uncharacterized protein YkwD